MVKNEISKADRKILFLMFTAILAGGLLSFLGNMSANFVWKYYEGTLGDMFNLGLSNLIAFVFLIIVLLCFIYKFSKF